MRIAYISLHWVRGQRVNRDKILMIDNAHKEEERLRFFNEIHNTFGAKK